MSASAYILSDNMLAFRFISTSETLLFNFIHQELVEEKENARKRLYQCSCNVATRFRCLNSIHNLLSLPLEPRTKKSSTRVDIENCMRSSTSLLRLLSCILVSFSFNVRTRANLNSRTLNSRRTSP